MGYSLRILFINEDDSIKKIPLSRFDRVRNRDPKERCSEYIDSRVRYAEVLVELENRKPIAIERIVYGYLKFDSHGRVDKNSLDEEMRVAMSMLPSISLFKNSENVINASHKFAKKRFKNEFSWIPTPELEIAIIEKILK